MISFLVAVLITFAFASASPVVDRLSGCTVPVPVQCTKAEADYQVRLSQILTNPSSMTRQRIREILLLFLSTLCSSTCLTPSVTNFRCANESDLADFSLRGVCGRNGDTYCPVQLMDFVIDGINPNSTCAASGTCNSTCQTTLRTIAKRWGCCAASWYTNSRSPYAGVSNQYRTCEVHLGSACPAPETEAAARL